MIRVAGVEVPSEVAETDRSRPHLAVVTSSYGQNSGEREAAVRAIVGAVLTDARVTVVSLDGPATDGIAPPRQRMDGLATVISASAPPSRARVEQLARASFAIQPEGLSGLPDVAERGLLTLLGQPTADAIGILDDLSPDIVLLAGPETFWMGEALPVGPGRPRVVLLPLLGTDPALGSARLEPYAEIADAVGALSDAEARLLGRSVGRRRPDAVERLHLSFPVNRGAAQSGLAGIGSFGDYVLLLTGWPDDDPAVGPRLEHDLVREAVGTDISVAEVRHDRWIVTDAEREFDVPWATTRMNVWRLMARGLVTVDLRPPGPVGREAIESLLFATPVVVPAGSVAGEHATVSGGGVCFGGVGEAVTLAASLLGDPEGRAACGERGRAWAEREHLDTERAVEEGRRLVFGGG